MKVKRMLPPVYLFLSIVIMIILHFVFPLMRIIVFPLNLIGTLPFGLGIVINLTADTTFKKYNTTVKPFEKPTTLVTSGVFRFSRHPMYLGFVLVLAGIAILMGSLTPFLVIIAFAILIDTIFIRAEEEMLEQTFGDAWLKYKGKVRRWI